MRTELNFNADIALENIKGGKGVFSQNRFLNSQQCSELRTLADSFETDRFGTVRGLLNKSDLFTKLLMSPSIKKLAEGYFQSPFRLGSLDIKIEGKVTDLTKPLRPHVDYPGAGGLGLITGVNSPLFGLPLSLKLFIPLTDLTIDNGATAYVPYSYRFHDDPSKHPEKFEAAIASGHVERLIVPEGTLNIWTGAMWHADLHNTTDRQRYLLHICLVPVHIVPPHDILATYGQSWLKQQSEEVQAICGLHDT
ncbi:phytanoyl-CoA dioxygenase family protein [Epibacterium ulvae]|uniref:phytanoyl-CoA dioxygenase family protein n=1 Tax=Epibacterium ulvae TaxID=1156985 RepID=UPI002493B724|nr:phytanoyl-CoA dioxygenase family protein [Epibacterium ulvae]